MQVARIASAWLAIASASPAVAAESVASYDIRLRAAGAAVEVTGGAVLPPLAEGGRTWSFLLTPLVGRPFFALTCARRALPLAGLFAGDDGGDRRWTLVAAAECPAGSVLRLAFRYRIEAAAPQLRISDSWSFATGGGEIWYPQRSFAERETARITLDLPARFTGIATGRLTARARRGGREILRYAAEEPAKLAFAYGPYRDAAAGAGRPVRVLSTGSGAEARRLVAALSPVIGALTRVFGPAPYPSLALVETDFRSRVLGTSEYGMLFADPSKMRGEFDIAYWAHEFGHQWWGNSVRSTSGSSGAALLTEAIAQYGALVTLEALAGGAAAAEYRRSGRPGSAAHSLQFYRDLAASGRDVAPASFLPNGQDEILLGHRLATSKGALVLYYLAALAGPERFHALLRSFLAAKAGGRATWAELEQWIDRGTDGRFRWLFEDWLHRAGAPRIAVAWCIAGDRVRGTVRQAGTPYRLALPIEVAGGWGSIRATVAASGELTPFELHAPGAIGRVAADPDSVVPALAIATAPPAEGCSG